MRRIYRSTIVLVMLGIVAPTPTSSAAIQCFHYETLAPDYQVPSPVESYLVPRPISDILTGDQPVNREGASSVPSRSSGIAKYDIRYAGENLIRCVADAGDQVLLTNSTTAWRFRHFPEGTRRSGLDVTANDVIELHSLGNFMRLSDGRYCCDISISVEGQLYDGELVFVDHRGTLYLDSSTLQADLS